MSRVPRLASDLVAAIAVAIVVLVVAGHVFPNYDAFYALIWGREIASGGAPDYYAPGAPAAHPLVNVVAALAHPLGEHAAVEVFRFSGPLAVGALCVGLFRLGEAVYDWRVGLVAAAVLATRAPTLIAGARSYVDPPTAALIVWAAVLEARRSRRGAPVFVLLGLAGLLRPEAWLLSVLYLVWVLSEHGRTDRARLIALALSGPALWLLSTLAATGTLLGPSHGAALSIAKTPAAFGPSGLLAVPEAFARSLGNFMAPIPLVLAVAAIAGSAISRQRRMLLPLAIALANAAAFAAVGLVGLPLVQRYLFPAAAMLSLFVGLAVAGSTPFGTRGARRTWTLAAAVLLLASVAISDARRIDDARTLLASEEDVQADLHALVRHPTAAEALRRARVVQLQNPRTLPLLAYWTGRPPNTFSSGASAAGAPSVFIAARSPAAETYLVGRVGALPAPPYEPTIANASWALHIGP